MNTGKSSVMVMRPLMISEYE